jgi:hypothetical protein
MGAKGTVDSSNTATVANNAVRNIWDRVKDDAKVYARVAAYRNSIGDTDEPEDPSVADGSSPPRHVMTPLDMQRYALA